MRIHGVGAVILAALAGPFGAIITPGLGTTFQGGIEKSILVTVVGESSLPVADLTADDFIVREDNVQRPVIDAKLATDRLFIAILVDTAKPMAGVAPPTQELRRGLSAFLNILSTAGAPAEIALYEFGGVSLRTVDFTRSAAALTVGIQRMLPSERSSAVLFEALVDASRSLSDKPSPRRAVVSINFNAPESSAIHPNNVLEAVRKSGATAWAISIQELETASAAQAGRQAMDNTMAPKREDLLNAMTRSTGGVRLKALDVSSLETHLTTVANALISQYVVTYNRPTGATVRQIHPELRRGGKVLMSSWVR